MRVDPLGDLLENRAHSRAYLTVQSTVICFCFLGSQLCGREGCFSPSLPFLSPLGSDSTCLLPSLRLFASRAYQR